MIRIGKAATIKLKYDKEVYESYLDDLIAGVNLYRNECVNCVARDCPFRDKETILTKSGPKKRRWYHFGKSL